MLHCNMYNTGMQIIKTAFFVTVFALILALGIYSIIYNGAHHPERIIDAEFPVIYQAPIAAS